MGLSLRTGADCLLVNSRQGQKPLWKILDGDVNALAGGFEVTDIPVGQWASSEAKTRERQWCDRLLAKADRIAAHRLSFLSLADHYLGNPIDWNRDYENDKSCPMKYSSLIDYRDTRVVGDCKFVWEPSRHHQLVVLGRAYRISGEDRYAQAVIEQLTSWLDQCPFERGMQWRSPLELAIRIINWVWTVDLIGPSGLVSGDFREKLLNSVHNHLWSISRNYSYGSSSNNHLIGEAAGVFIGSSYFCNLKKASQWRDRARRLLYREIFAQTFRDGGHREQAIGYHLFVLQFLLISAIVAKRTREEFPPEYWNRLEKMFEFISILSEAGPHLPMIGDADDGYVLDLGGDPHDVREWLAIGSDLFGREDFKHCALGHSESARWLLGSGSGEGPNDPGRPKPDRALQSAALRETGYYLLQYGQGENAISVVFDCGPLGYGALAAHGHADALSFVLRAFGVDVLVDPGTYDYFTYRQWREYFRSTRAHNTVVIDRQDQSVMEGSFLWSRRAHPRCLIWDPSAQGGRVMGEHDGYVRLDDPLVHHRTLELDGRARRLIIRDDLIADGGHDVEVFYHFAEQARVERLSARCFKVDVGPGELTVTMDNLLTVEELTCSTDPIAGWVSRGYHQKVPGTSLIGRCRIEGNTSLQCQIDIGQPRTVPMQVSKEAAAYSANSSQMPNTSMEP